MRSNDPLPWLGVQAPLDLPRASLDRSVSSPAPGHALSPDGLTMEELVAKYLTSRAYFLQRGCFRFRACVSARLARSFDPFRRVDCRHAKYVELKGKWEQVEPQLEQLRQQSELVEKLHAENKLLREAVQILKSQAAATAATAAAAAPVPAASEASAASFGFGDNSGSWAAFGGQPSSAEPAALPATEPESVSATEPASVSAGSSTQPSAQLSAGAQMGRALFAYAAADETEVRVACCSAAPLLCPRRPRGSNGHL